MKKTAIILGASGLTGNILLHKLIEDKSYDSIKLFSRSKIEGLPNKVIQFTGNLLKLEEFKADFTADEVFCCIGTTAKKTPNKKRYKQIDFGIPVTAAKLAKENKIEKFIVISAIGANKKSSVFYNKTKGEMEHAVLQQSIKNTLILRPSLIGGDRKEQRLGEKIALVFFKVMQPLLIGKLEEYKTIDAENIAKAMLYLANNKTNTKVIFTSNEILKLSKKELK
jgi:uncharacterized protein YbjT (DUF2867 family)